MKKLKTKIGWRWRCLKVWVIGCGGSENDRPATTTSSYTTDRLQAI
jgi:hypothetical protein